MRVAIVGGTGFIGQHVARQLAQAGAQVWTVGRGTTPSAIPGTQTLRADRHEPAALRQALASAAPAVVIDMIAYRQEDIERLIAALPPSAKRLVVISSADVYRTYGSLLGLEAASDATEPSDEQAPLRTELFPYRRQAKGPEDRLYGYEKILVERAANAWTGGATTVLRLPMVYGPNDKQRRVADCLARLQASGGSLRVNSAEAAWKATRGYVEDVAAAIKLAALSEAAAGKVFNVGDNVALSELAWIRAVASAAGWHGEVLADDDAAPTLPVNWSAHLTVDTTRIRAELGHDEPVGRQEGLRRTIASRSPAASPAPAADD